MESVFIYAMEGIFFMPRQILNAKLNELMRDNATLLWLEGAKYECVKSLRVSGNTLILSLNNGIVRMINFEKYMITKVGLQFWSQGRPGVLYRWDQVRTQPADITSQSDELPIDKSHLA